MKETASRSVLGEPNNGQKKVRVVRWACLAVIAILTAGLWLQMPYLGVEHGRLPLSRTVELWCADILALVWFGRFAIEHAVLGESLVAVAFADARRQIRIVLIAGATALLVDLLFIFSLMLNERERYASGTVTEATPVAIRRIDRPATTWYEVDCKFKDDAGQSRQAHVRVEANHHRFPATLPRTTAEVLTAPRRGADQVSIRYDPQLPARAWADGAGWDDGQRIYWFALLTLFFQAIITALCLLLLGRSRGEFLPWWWDIYKVLPLVVAAFWLFLMGIIDRLMD